MKKIKIFALLCIVAAVFIAVNCSSKRKYVDKPTSTEKQLQKELAEYEKNKINLEERKSQALKLGQIRRDDLELQKYIEALYFVDEYERRDKTKEKDYHKYLSALMTINEYERKNADALKSQKE